MILWERLFKLGDFSKPVKSINELLPKVSNPDKIYVGLVSTGSTFVTIFQIMDSILTDYHSNFSVPLSSLEKLINENNLTIEQDELDAVKDILENVEHYFLWDYSRSSFNDLLSDLRENVDNVDPTDPSNQAALRYHHSNFTEQIIVLRHEDISPFVGGMAAPLMASGIFTSGFAMVALYHITTKAVNYLSNVRLLKKR